MFYLKFFNQKTFYPKSNLNFRILLLPQKGGKFKGAELYERREAMKKVGSKKKKQKPNNKKKNLESFKLILEIIKLLLEILKKHK